MTAATPPSEQDYSPGIDWGINTDLEAVTGSAEPSVFACEHTDFVFACGIADPAEALTLMRARPDDIAPHAPSEDDIADFRLRWCRRLPGDTAGPELEYVDGPHTPGAFPAIVWHA
ncbi:hypothetical protein ACFXPA_46540 [Amycolatopsis sp. NPDC059090]|uniref:hypothetical protein n=2 Tax=unclassified Amycolatopsis TaxID=2618356 RepID=UPI0036725BE0